MGKRYMCIWFRHLLTDWLILRQPELADIPFGFTAKDHGRLLITATNSCAEQQGIFPGMVAADAKALVPSLKLIDEIPGKKSRLLRRLGEWCIRYSPYIALDEPEGLILDVSGCAHLWGGERKYLKEIVSRLRSKGYDVRAAMADTIGAAWGIARLGKVSPIIEAHAQAQALLALPPEALRLEVPVLERLRKLGFRTLDSFITMPKSVLRRRFGPDLIKRLDQALGNEEEAIQPIHIPDPYHERLPCLEPIRTAVGIEIAIRKLLDMLCQRLQKEGKGVRTAVFKGYRIDGKIVQMEIGTNVASHHAHHLFKLFALKIDTLEPALGIELFTLDAPQVEDILPGQEVLWNEDTGLEDEAIAELLDRLAGKVGAAAIRRYLPVEHYWPERSIRASSSIRERPSIKWRTDRPRPVQLLAKPELIEVTAPIPDYPPMVFRYKGETHQVKKADGPERIEREWWLESGQHRDYYQVEDEKGRRYWLFRAGHYDEGGSSEWFIHGFFA
jgi:protein ImuB